MDQEMARMWSVLEMPKVARIYHHYEKWEEWHAGMWNGIPRDREPDMLTKAIEFTGNAELYGSYMMRAIDEWPVSCEQNLSNSSMNRLAWIGHAAACIAIGCPEHITRKAWGRLTQQQRDEANARAHTAVETWLGRYRGNGRQLAFQF
jgi:hypothetical protein